MGLQGMIRSLYVDNEIKCGKGVMKWEGVGCRKYTGGEMCNDGDAMEFVMVVDDYGRIRACANGMMGMVGWWV